MSNHAISLLILDALPPKTSRGTIVRLLEQVGGIDKNRIGKTDLRGRTATVEVPSDWMSRLVKALDGTALGTQRIRAGASTTSAPRRGEDHFQRLIRLMEMESRAEASAMLAARSRASSAAAERTGNCLVDLVVRDEFPGLGGRMLVTLGKRNLNSPLPWTRLGIGSPVLFSEQSQSANTGWRGVVSDISTGTIQVALTQYEEPEVDGPQFRLDLSTDEVARQRQKMALERARLASGDRLAQMRSVMLAERPPRYATRPPPQGLDDRLNKPQRRAVEFALAAEDLAIIHGPPGTGKTTTVVELMLQAVQRGEKVLACAPSNLAVDNLLQGLVVRGARVIRLGHPARVLSELRDHTLDLLVDRHADVKLARKLVRAARLLRDRAAKFRRAKPQPGEKREMREEARRLMDDARRMEAMVVEQILDQADIVCATTTGLDSELLGQRSFDLAVIDEACQSTEPACWIPLLRCQRLVVAGDHCQLPPTVLSAEAAREGFAVSLMERLIQVHGAEISCLLTTQYRMHEQIMNFSSSAFYDSELVADEAVRDHLLADLDGVESNELTQRAIEFFDTAGASCDEQPEPDGESRLNPGEAELVGRLLGKIFAAGVSPRDVGVITPYAAQVRHLREKLDQPGLEIDTVDGFQGREKEAIIVSLVRSNPEGEIGFLADIRRMNVALTRARRKLIVIGDSATISQHEFYVRLMEYFESVGAYRTIWELQE